MWKNIYDMSPSKVLFLHLAAPKIKKNKKIGPTLSHTIVWVSGALWATQTNPEKATASQSLHWGIN